MTEKEHIADNSPSPKETGDHSDVVDQAENQTKQEAGENLEPVSEGQSEVEKLSAELDEAKDKHLRLYSEFENFRRRTAKERLELIGTANENLITSLLPIIDDFERAQQATEAEGNAQLEGMNLIYQKLMKELSKQGLKPMDNLVGKSFDAEVHEAISQVPAPKNKLKNRIVDVVEKGYYLNDKVIRYAKVVIGT